MKVGVFIGQALMADGINASGLAAYAANLPDVKHVRILGFRPRLDPERLAGEIRQMELERIVIAADSPGYFKPAFTRAAALAGANPEEVRLASFREHGAGTAGETDRAKAIIACAVEGVPFSLVAIPRETSINRSTLIVGAGIAGIQAALEIADGGNQVYLVERSPTIGGHMAMFDKTFPTLDCAACILTPKMVAVGEHKMIDLITHAEVTEIGGRPGDYRVKVLRRARRVDIDACVACNACTDICPVSAWSEFDCNLVRRKAIYIPFPQAVPNAYVVDAENCLWVQSAGKRCGACLKKCPKDCIHLDEQDQTVDLEVGNIILATGYELFDAEVIRRYGYGIYPNVLTSLEFERMTNASGPTGGKIVLKTKKFNKRTKSDEWLPEPDGPPPKSVAIIHCVGSRDTHHNHYCSRVCCMYSLKFAHLVREKLPQTACYEFYIDMRAFGKGYEEFMERIKSEGVHVVRGRSANVAEINGQLMVKGEDILQERVIDFPVDMVILAVGVVPARGHRKLARLLGVPLGDDGWFTELDYNGEPTITERGSVYVAGMCQSPKDIPDTVAQASAVAAGVLCSLSSGHGVGNLDSLTLSEIETQARQAKATVAQLT